jgi:hypothetical protein
MQQEDNIFFCRFVICNSLSDVCYFPDIFNDGLILNLIF